MEATYKIEMIRSDLGDGGWSLHAHRIDVTDESDSTVEYPLLSSGESERDENGWTSPTDADYAEAQAKARKLAERYQIEVVEG